MRYSRAAWVAAAGLLLLLIAVVMLRHAILFSCAVQGLCERDCVRILSRSRAGVAYVIENTEAKFGRRAGRKLRIAEDVLQMHQDRDYVMSKLKTVARSPNHPLPIRLACWQYLRRMTRDPQFLAEWFQAVQPGLAIPEDESVSEAEVLRSAEAIEFSRIWLMSAGLSGLRNDMPMEMPELIRKTSPFRRIPVTTEEFSAAVLKAMEIQGITQLP